jgi:pyrroloquinoline quinone (PQQ) biosynthesis protein C
MALDDLAALGEDVSSIPQSHPLPSTMALISFPFYQVEHLNPVGYLGYLYFLEFMPTRQGAQYGAALAKLGVPSQAMTFLAEHVAVDVGHNKMMEQYLGRLVHDEDDLRSAVYALKVTGKLYAEMLRGAMQRAEEPVDYGDAPEERRRLPSGEAGADPAKPRAPLPA